jgi:hypothetical protein
MEIKMPPSFTLRNTISFCRQLDCIEKRFEECCFDYEHMTFVEPFGMLLAAARIREFMEHYEDVEFSDVSFKQHTYAANMGFFQNGVSIQVR